MWQLKPAMGSSCDLWPSTLVCTYNSILKPRLIYAVVVWLRRIKKKTIVLPLEKVRGLVLMEVTGSAKSTPTASLGALLGIGHLQKSLSVQAVKIYYGEKNAHGCRRTRICSRTKIVRSYFFQKK